MTVALQVLPTGQKPAPDQPTKPFTKQCGTCAHANTCFRGLNLEEAMATLEKSGATHVEVVMSAPANSCADARKAIEPTHIPL